MVSYPSPASVQFNTFKGIRTRNGIAAGGTISAVTCKNIDFIPSSYDAGINIVTSLGNVKYCDLSDTADTNDDYSDYTIIKGFEFETENDLHLLFYCENGTNGVLLEYKNNEFEIVFDELQTNNGKANGITMIDNAYNTFVFTNGLDYVAWCPDAVEQSTVKRTLNPEIDSTPVTGVALAELDGSLVIGCDNGYVLASARNDITDFDVLGGLDTSAWYETFGKPITAVVSMTGGLIVFTAEDNTLLSGYQKIATRDRKDSNLGGCLSFESWVKHDKYLFFYDNRQKNIYYYTQNDYGQMVLGEPVAPEIQKYFSDINRLQMTSYIGKNRSEIWVMTNKNKLIFDFFIQEWSERDCQDLNSYFAFDNDVFSVGGSKCFREKVGNIGYYDGEFIPSEYKTQIINLGSFSNMKEMEFQPLLSVDTDYNNTFTIDCMIDGKKVKSKYVKMYYNGAIWADDNPQDEYTTDNELWADDEGTVGQTFPYENESIIQQVKGKFISNWYYLQFTFRTTYKNDDFSISCLELKGITQETDTTGRK